MTLRNFIVSIIVLNLQIVFSGCRTSPKLSFDVPALDTTIKTTRISLSYLAENYKNYHGKYVETEGTFSQAFERFAVNAEKKIPTAKAQSFWLGLNPRLNVPQEAFGRMNGQRVKLKGIVDTMYKGHLSQYIATIDSIYFWHQY